MLRLFRKKSDRRIDVTVYSRQNCHLCDDAKVLLFKHLAERTVSFIEMDIDDDPELVARYGDCVPVVVIDGIERFRGKVNEVLLKRLLTSL